MSDKLLPLDPLSLDIDDDKLLRFVKNNEAASRRFFEEEKKLGDRREKLKKYFFGRQYEDRRLKRYELKVQDNVIWEISKTINAIVFSRTPDLIVTSTKDDPASQANAARLSKIVNDSLKKRLHREVLKKAVANLPTKLLGCVKYRWDKKSDDYTFEYVDPENLILDPTARSVEDPGNFIGEKRQAPLRELLLMFPEKREQILQEAARLGIRVEDGAHTLTNVTFYEFWFHWFESNTFLSGVLWRFGDTILKKIKNPNWDWEGEQVVVDLSEEEIRADVLRFSPLPQRVIYRNYFDRPEFPYILFGTEQYGSCLVDETSWVEQIVPMQENLDERHRQITAMLRRARGKHVWSKMGGLKKEDLEEFDPNDPDQDMLVDGEVNKVHAFVPGEQPSAQLLQDVELTRARMFAKAGTFATRGELQTSVATSNQIAREADFTRADYFVDSTVNYASEKMARAALQLIKLRYSPFHYVKILGPEGLAVHEAITGDMVEDGMEVVITASGTDKLRAERRAIDMAKLNLIDPLTFYQDIQATNPRDRTEKLLLFSQNPAEYLAKIGQNPSQEVPLSPPPLPEPDLGSEPVLPTPADTTQVPLTPPVL